MNAPTAPAAAVAKNDFADWLSPMLVKELRQSVRSRLFVSTFIMLQAIMLLTMVLGLITATEGSTSESTVAFWIIVGIFVLVILPMGGINAVGGEIKANTLELIFLTRLSSLRIVAGKWLAIFAASVLLVTAVLPYLVLRYFMGGVNITTELGALFYMLAGSAWLTAVTVGLSSFHTRVARWVVGVLIFFVLQSGVPFFFMGRMAPGMSFGLRSSWQLVYLFVGGAISMGLMLDAGASKIAPAAENHSGIQRALVLGLLAVAALANASPGDAHTVTILAFVLAALVCAAALCEEPRWIGSIYRPFAARGFFGRLAGRLLYPGWHTGLWYVTVIFAGFAALLWHLKMLHTTAAVIRLTALAGMLLLPPAVTRLFFPKTQKPLVIFFVVQVACLILTIVTGIVDQALKTKTGHLISFLPLCSLIQSLDSEQKRVWGVALIGVPLVTAASWLTLLVLGTAPMRRTREMEKGSPSTAVAPPDGTLA